MRHATLHTVLMIAVTVFANGCSCNPVGRWAQQEIEHSDKAMAHTLAITGESLARATSLDGWRAAIAPGMQQAARDVERDAAYTKRTAGRITEHVADETARIIPYTADAAANVASYVGSETKRLGSWFCCEP